MLPKQHSNWALLRTFEAKCDKSAGAFFGAAWWVLADAVVYSKAILGANVPWTYFIPGVAATLALILMNLVSREELHEISEDSYEEGALVGLHLCIICDCARPYIADRECQQTISNHCRLPSKLVISQHCSRSLCWHSWLEIMSHLHLLGIECECYCRCEHIAGCSSAIW